MPSPDSHPFAIVLPMAGAAVPSCFTGIAAALLTGCAAFHGGMIEHGESRAEASTGTPTEAPAETPAENPAEAPAEAPAENPDADTITRAPGEEARPQP